MRKTIIVSSILLLSGCDTWLDVRGELSPGSETFTGSTNGFALAGGGSLNMRSNRGRVCVGQYKVKKRKGSGVLECTDGQTGSIEFDVTGRNRATGTATIGGRTMKFEIAHKFE